MTLHRFDRLELLFGKEALTRLKGAKVMVFGVGGVGSYAVEALVRGGVGSLTLIDFDRVCITNSNRQIHANAETVGEGKVQVMAARARLINPDLHVTPLNLFFEKSLCGELLDPPPDYVLDCIDNITAKLDLIEYCVMKGIPVISSMGAANKIDPTLIRVDDISRTSTCRLAKVIRKTLRKRGIPRGVNVVYSLEEFHPLAAVATDSGVTALPDGARARVPLGSASYIPPIFGLTMA